MSELGGSSVLEAEIIVEIEVRPFFKKLSSILS